MMDNSQKKHEVTTTPRNSSSATAGGVTPSESSNNGKLYHLRRGQGSQVLPKGAVGAELQDNPRLPVRGVNAKPVHLDDVGSGLQSQHDFHFIL